MSETVIFKENPLYLPVISHFGNPISYSQKEWIRIYSESEIPIDFEQDKVDKRKVYLKNIDPDTKVIIDVIPDNIYDYDIDTKQLFLDLDVVMRYCLSLSIQSNVENKPSGLSDYGDIGITYRVIDYHLLRESNAILDFSNIRRLIASKYYVSGIWQHSIGSHLTYIWIKNVIPIVLNGDLNKVELTQIDENAYSFISPERFIVCSQV